MYVRTSFAGFSCSFSAASPAASVASLTLDSDIRPQWSAASVLAASPNDPSPAPSRATSSAANGVILSFMPNVSNASGRPPRPRLYGSVASDHPKAPKNCLVRMECTPRRPPLRATVDTTSPANSAMSCVTARFRSLSMRGIALRRSASGKRSTLSSSLRTFTSLGRGSLRSLAFFLTQRSRPR